MGRSAVRLEQVSKAYVTGDGPLEVLDGVDLDVDEGECVAVVGPSGSGKTTVLAICGLLLRPDRGRRLLGGIDVTDIDDDEGADLRFRAIGFCFQSFLLAPALTALENVMLPGLPRKLDFDVRDRAAHLLERVGLDGRLDHLPAQLSGGEQQRVAIARSLFADPPVLLVDEPTANLDRRTAGAIAALLARLSGDPGRAILIATHDSVIADVAHRILYLESGRLVQAG